MATSLEGVESWPVTIFEHFYVHTSKRGYGKYGKNIQVYNPWWHLEDGTEQKRGYGYA